MNKQTKDWCDVNQFKTKGNFIIGKRNNVSFTILPVNNFIYFSFNMSCPSQNLEMNLREKLTEENKKIGKTVAREKQDDNNSDLVVIRVTYNMNQLKPEDIELILDKSVEEIKSLGGEENHKCIHCGKETKEMVYFNENIHSMCDDCSKKIDDLNDSNNDTPASYLRGILGAIIGAIIGGIPWMLVYLCGWVVAILAFVIGIGSFTFYKLFKGPRSRAAANIIIWTTSLISVVGWLLLIYMFMYSALTGRPMSLEFFGYSQVSAGFMQDFLLSIVMAVLGLAGINKKISTYTIPKNAEKIEL